MVHSTRFGALGRDLRFAFRMMLKSPVFSATIILSLMLGIGANTAIFSLIHAVLLKPLPVENPEELVLLSDPGSSGTWVGTEQGVRSLISYPEFEHFQRNCDAFSGLIASQSGANALPIHLQGGAEDERVRSRMVSANYFEVLGVKPILGRTFSRESGREPLAVLSYPYWKSRFGLDPSVVGKTILVHDASFAIAGIMAPGFFGETVGKTPDMWLPLRTQPLVLPGRDLLNPRPNLVEKVMFLHVFGRLRPGIERAAAEAQVNQVFKRLIESEAGPNLSEDLRTEFLDQRIVLHDGSRGASSFRSSFSEPLFILMGVVGLILLLACSNVATLLLVRATVRERELGIRLAIGASRRQIVRQMLTESILLSFVGGACGIAFAIWAAGALVTMVLDGPSPIAPGLRPDLAVLGFTVAVSVLTGILFGLAPAYRGLRADVNSALRQGRVMGRGGHHRLGKGLVAAQVAFSLLLLIGAGLFLRTLSNLASQELGYDRDNLLLVRVDSVSAGYEDGRRLLLFEDLSSRLSARPGVTAVAYSENGVLSGTESGDSLWVEGYTGSDDLPSARWDRVGPGYFETLGMPIVLGRSIGPQDTASSPFVTVINETMARDFFGQESPLGKRIRIEFGGNRYPEYTIVGVSKDAHSRSLRGRVGRRFYMPLLQPLDEGTGSVYFLVRTLAKPSDAATSVRETILGRDGNLQLGGVVTLERLVDNQLSQERLIARLSSAFGIVALLLSLIGLYGLMSYSIARRTNEIGVRMAIGAPRGQVARMVLRETAMLTVLGIAAGLAMTFFGTRLVSGFLFGVSPLDPWVSAAAAVILLAASGCAGLIPALRAARISPLEALRSQ